METSSDDTDDTADEDDDDDDEEEDDGGSAGFGVEQVFRFRSKCLGELAAGGGSEMSGKVWWCWSKAGFFDEGLHNFDFDLWETGEIGSVRGRYGRGSRSVMAVVFSRITDAEGLGNFGGV